MSLLVKCRITRLRVTLQINKSYTETNNEKCVKKEYRTGGVVFSAGHASVPYAAHDKQPRKSGI